jgi:phenylalanyl-tRNA synthetase beta chain
VLAGPLSRPVWRGGVPRPFDVFDAKGIAEGVLDGWDLGVAWRAASHPSMHPGRTAGAYVGATCVAWAGELHPVVAERWGLDQVALIELDLDAVAKLSVENARTFKPFAPYPPVKEDLAVVVAEDVTAASVEEVIRRAAGPMLVGLELFDVFRGAQVGEARKSLAWSLTFQAPDRTLTGQDAEGLRRKVVRSLEAQLGATLRA